VQIKKLVAGDISIIRFGAESPAVAEIFGCTEKNRERLLALGLADPVCHPAIHFTVIIIIEHSARARVSATGKFLIAGTGTPGSVGILRRLHCFLLRQVNGEIVHPGNKRAGDCDADDEQDEPCKGRLFVWHLKTPGEQVAVPWFG